MQIDRNFKELFHMFIVLQSDEGRTGKDVAHEKRIRRELEKQDLLRRKVWSCSFSLNVF